MGRFFNWLAKDRDGALAPRAGGASRRTRRLNFERCEERIALSTTADGGDDSVFLGFIQPAESDSDQQYYAVLEGRSISTEIHQELTVYLKSHLTQLQITRNAFPGEFPIRLFDRGGGPGALEVETTLAATDRGVINGTTWAITRNAFSELGDSIDLDPLGGLNSTSTPADAVGLWTQPEHFGSPSSQPAYVLRILPIAPLPNESSQDGGGQIAMTAFSGPAMLGSPGTVTSTGLANAASSPARPASDFSNSARRHEPVDSMRARAVVYEVAQANGLQGQGEPQGTPSEALIAKAKGAKGGLTSSAQRQSAAASFDSLLASYAGAMVRRAPNSPRSSEPLFVELNGVDLPAQADMAADAAESSASTRSTTDARDQAFAALDVHRSASSEEVPASDDSRQRQAAGLAAMLVLGAGPLSKLLRREQQSLVEQLPPRRMQRR